jgi:anti-sigma factor RsiW
MSAAPSSADGRTVSPNDCEHAVRRLWDYLDGRLPDVAREEVEKHLATCEGCPPRFAFAEKMQHALRASAVPERPFESAGEAETRLQSRVREALWRQIVPGARGPADN